MVSIPYNGFTAEYRNSQSKVLTGMIRRGEITPATACEACGRTGRLQQHLEDYSAPETMVALCSTCHLILHMRERNIGWWHRFRLLIRDGWRPPGMMPASISQAMGRDTLPDGTWPNGMRDSTPLDSIPDRQVDLSERMTGRAPSGERPGGSQ